MVTRDTVEDEVAKFSSKISENDFPSDGLVLTYDDIAYGRSLGRTAKFPRDSFAFKWQDEIRETVLREIEWSPSQSLIRWSWKERRSAVQVFTISVLWKNWNLGSVTGLKYIRLI